MIERKRLLKLKSAHGPNLEIVLQTTMACNYMTEMLK